MYVVAISVATIGLWCANTALSKYTGQMGIVAIVPMVAFFGFGLLSKVGAVLINLAACFEDTAWVGLPSIDIPCLWPVIISILGSLGLFFLMGCPSVR